MTQIYFKTVISENGKESIDQDSMKIKWVAKKQANGTGFYLMNPKQTLRYFWFPSSVKSTEINQVQQNLCNGSSINVVEK